METVLIIGGDRRSYYLAMFLRKKGYDISCLDVPGAPADICQEGIDYGRYDTIILPVPVTKDGKNINCPHKVIDMDEIIGTLNRLNSLCGGVIPEQLVHACYEADVFCYDFMKDDQVAVKNAVATAEGAVMEAFLMSDKNIEGSKCLVSGFGRCGRVLADKLNCFGAEVTVMIRSEEAYKKVQSFGYRPMYFSDYKRCAESYDYCFNTVPAMVIGSDIIKHMPPDIVIIDIASKPGGCDFACLEKHGIKYRHSLGIPGRYSPEASGRILAEACIAKGI